MKIILRSGDRVRLNDASVIRVVWIDKASITLELSGTEEESLGMELLPAQRRGPKGNGKTTASRNKSGGKGGDRDGRRVDHRTGGASPKNLAR